MNCKSIAWLGASIAAGSMVLHTALAQQPTGIYRTELQREDLVVPGREVVQVRVELEPGVLFECHKHPGDEIIYVIEGTFEYQVEGRGTVRVGAGEVLFIPSGVLHSARNVGNGNAAELATYVVEIGKPLIRLTGR
jgi:quercetin dioxygenase-like cupin family protein